MSSRFYFLVLLEINKWGKDFRTEDDYNEDVNICFNFTFYGGVSEQIHKASANSRLKLEQFQENIFPGLPSAHITHRKVINQKPSNKLITNQIIPAAWFKYICKQCLAYRSQARDEQYILYVTSWAFMAITMVNSMTNQTSMEITRPQFILPGLEPLTNERKLSSTDALCNAEIVYVEFVMFLVQFRAWSWRCTQLAHIPCRAAWEWSKCQHLEETLQVYIGRKIWDENIRQILVDSLFQLIDDNSLLFWLINQN